MLDLKARVHFKKIEIALGIDDELDRPGRAIADGACQRHRLFAHFRARHLIEKRAWAFLQYFLVAALDRTFALAQIQHLAVAVGQHLDFDVARAFDVFFDEHAVVAEACLGFTHGARESVANLGVGARDPHALAAAAGRRLQHHRIADALCDAHRFLGVGDRLGMAGDRADAGRLGEALRFDLVAHRLDRLGRGADEHDVAARKLAREAGVLRQETITRMDRARAALFGGNDDLVHVEIALRRRRGSDRDRAVGHLDVARIAVGVGINRHGLEAERARGADDAACDLAPIGDQQRAERKFDDRHGQAIPSGWADSSAWRAAWIFPRMSANVIFCPLLSPSPARVAPRRRVRKRR